MILSRRKVSAAGSAGVLAAVLLAGCTGSGTPSERDAQPEQGEKPSGAPTLDWRSEPERSTVQPQRLTQAGLDRATWVSGFRLPRKMPTDLSELPSLLDDLPGRAVATVYGEVNDITGQPSRLDYPTPWARETVYFYGDDGRWRVLHMEDLKLPKAGWQGSDNYGAGELSPDGRWWAMTSLRGSVVMDLKTGELHRGPAGDAAVLYRWTADSERVHITNQGIGPGQWATAPDFDDLRPAQGRIYPYAEGYVQPAGRDKTPPLAYEFYDNDGDRSRVALVGENILGPPFEYRDAGQVTVEHGYLAAVSSTGKQLAFQSSLESPGRSYSTELTIVGVEESSVSARARFPVELVLDVDSFENDLWLLDPGLSDRESRKYPGMRYVWDAATGDVKKLIDLTLSDSEYRIYDFSYARDLVKGDRP